MLTEEEIKKEIDRRNKSGKPRTKQDIADEISYWILQWLKEQKW